MTFNRIQSRVVTGLLTGHNTLRRHLYLLGLLATPCVGSAGWERKPRLTYYVSARLWPHSDMRTWAPFFWEQEDIRSLGLGAISKCSKVAGLP